MYIHNTISDFLHLYNNTNALGMDELEKYYKLHPTIFEEYFTYHCSKTIERLTQAIDLYPQKIEDIITISNTLPSIITEVMNHYKDAFEFGLDLHFNFLVGGFGSNAFVERKIKGQVYFAVEKLSPNPDHLCVIVAHEIGHIYHDVLSDSKQMNWKDVDWTNGMITLFREGVATYLSKKIVTNQEEAVYYSFDENGEKWLDFYQDNRDLVRRYFLIDCSKEWTFEKEREWFRLSGGKYFGYNRLGYYLGTSYVQGLINEVGEELALTFWCDNDIKSSVLKWLQKDCSL